MKATEKGLTYLLRNIDDNLWQRAKHAAIEQRVSLRTLILSALSDKLNRIREEEIKNEK